MGSEADRLPGLSVAKYRAGLKTTSLPRATLPPDAPVGAAGAQGRASSPAEHRETGCATCTLAGSTVRSWDRRTKAALGPGSDTRPLRGGNDVLGPGDLSSE